MPHATALAFPEENLVGWERAMIAFLVEKERRSGSSARWKATPACSKTSSGECRSPRTR